MPRANALHTRRWLIRGFLLCESHHCSYFHSVLYKYCILLVQIFLFHYTAGGNSNLPAFPLWTLCVSIVCCIHTFPQLPFKAPVLNFFLNYGFVIYCVILSLLSQTFPVVLLIHCSQSLRGLASIVGAHCTVHSADYRKYNWKKTIQTTPLLKKS